MTPFLNKKPKVKTLGFVGAEGFEPPTPWV